MVGQGTVDREELGRDGTDGTESPGDFLAKLGQALCRQGGVDASLAEILATHLLTAEPAADAVSVAKVAILKLANDRAIPPQREADDG